MYKHTHIYIYLYIYCTHLCQFQVFAAQWHQFPGRRWNLHLSRLAMLRELTVHSAGVGSRRQISAGWIWGGRAGGRRRTGWNRRSGWLSADVASPDEIFKGWVFQSLGSLWYFWAVRPVLQSNILQPFQPFPTDQLVPSGGSRSGCTWGVHDWPRRLGCDRSWTMLDPDLQPWHALTTRP